MEKRYFTVQNSATGGVEEKRSRFLAEIVHCETKEQAEIFVKTIRARYFDARHTVFAYLLRDGTSRFSDDGEPHGTAGKPVLDLINGENLCDVCLTVTRYFGGVLLGTGGLCRAYSAAAKDCISHTVKSEIVAVRRYRSVCDYSYYDTLCRLIASFGGTVEKTDFSDGVAVTYSLPAEQADDFTVRLSENFASRLAAELLCETFGMRKL